MPPHGDAPAASTSIHPDARPIVDGIIQRAVSRRASDIHVEPSAEHYEIRLRIDGLLETVDRYEPATGRAIVARLMVLAHLLTYRLDVPQEGRLSASIPSLSTELDLRLAIMPTTRGLRAAVRLPAELIQPSTLSELQLPQHVMNGLQQFVNVESGMLLFIGPAGSGKTTTIYALLRHIVERFPGLSIVSLEDPVEGDLPGVTQIEVSPFGQLTYERALRSILRQDPQVLALGEIRDADTATLALQAALSGHRLISTFHASSAAGAVARLIEMGSAPYQIASALYGVVSQRLVRRRTPRGYLGRVPVAEFVRFDEPARAAILRRDDAQTLQSLVHRQTGFMSLRQSAQTLIESDVTDLPEVARILGE